MKPLHLLYSLIRSHKLVLRKSLLVLDTVSRHSPSTQPSPTLRLLLGQAFLDPLGLRLLILLGLLRLRPKERQQQPITGGIAFLVGGGRSPGTPDRFLFEKVFTEKKLAKSEGFLSSLVSTLASRFWNPNIFLLKRLPLLGQGLTLLAAPPEELHSKLRAFQQQSGIRSKWIFLKTKTKQNRILVHSRDACFFWERLEVFYLFGRVLRSYTSAISFPIAACIFVTYYEIVFVPTGKYLSYHSAITFLSLA